VEWPWGEHATEAVYESDFSEGTQMRPTYYETAQLARLARQLQRPNQLAPHTFGQTGEQARRISPQVQAQVAGA